MAEGAFGKFGLWRAVNARARGNPAEARPFAGSAEVDSPPLINKTIPFVRFRSHQCPQAGLTAAPARRSASGAQKGGAARIPSLAAAEVHIVL